MKKEENWNNNTLECIYGQVKIKCINAMAHISMGIYRYLDYRVCL